MVLENKYAARFTRRYWLAFAVLAFGVLPLSAVMVDAAGEENDVAPSRGQSREAAVPTTSDQGLHSVAVQGHCMWALAFSPDGSIVAGGSVDGSIHLWNAQDGRVVHKTQGHKHDIRVIRFSADGKTLQTAGRSVKKWNISTGKLVETIEIDLQGAKRSSRLYAFSPDGQMLAGRLDRGTSQLAIWDAETGKINISIDLVGMPLDTAFSPDGGLLAVAIVAQEDKQKSTGALQIFDARTGEQKRLIETHPYSMYSVAFSPKGDLVAGGDHRKVRLWNVSTGALEQTFEGHSGVIESIAFSPDGTKMASGAQGPIVREPGVSTVLSETKVWDLESGQLVSPFADGRGRTIGIAFSPDGRRLARCNHFSLVCDELEGGRSWVKHFPSPTAIIE